MSISIRIAGNTTLPCLLAIQSKGYKITLSYIKEHHELEGLDVMTRINNLTAIYVAQKGDNKFSANNPEQLLGLIAMWEIRGNNWDCYLENEYDIEEELIKLAVVYDSEGNIIED